MHASSPQHGLPKYLGVILDSELSWGLHIIASVNLKLQEIVIKSVLRLKHHGTWNNHYIFGKGDKSNSHALISRSSSKQGKILSSGFSVTRNHTKQFNKHYCTGTVSIETVFQCELFALQMGCAWALGPGRNI